MSKLLLNTHPSGPVPDWEREWVLRELDGDLRERELAVEGEPRVVEAEPHERQQEVQLLVHLRVRVPVGLEIGELYSDDRIL